jgi:hypothetical protein
MTRVATDQAIKVARTASGKGAGLGWRADQLP